MSAAYSGPIVDAHHHYWDLGDGRYPWLQDDYDEDFFLGDYRTLRSDFLEREYLAATAGHDVVADVHVEAERSRAEQVQESSMLAAMHGRSGSPSVIVGHVGFTQPDRDEVLAAHAAVPQMRGIRSKPVTASSAHGVASTLGVQGSMQDEAWLSGLASLERHGMSWDLRVPAWHLQDAAEVVRHIPGIPVVLEHCGLPLDRSERGLASWRDGMEAVAANDHVTVKVSELGLRGGRWDVASNMVVIADVVRIFGWERVLFASNLPVSSLAVSFADLVACVLDALPEASQEQLDALFHANARRVYRIPA